jgi:D-alanine--poly(phosphoribitol) ligase subunit 1
MTNSFSNRDLLDIFFEQATLLPDHTAIVESKREINYRDFIDLVSRMAYHFRQISNHTKVLIHLPQSIEAYAAMMATLMAGGYYSPTNTSAPLERQRLVIDSFQPDIILSDANLLTDLEVDYPTLDIATIGQNRLKAPEPAHDLAYVMFTSGSTGIPKGVMIARESLDHYVEWAVESMSIKPSDRWSQQPNIGFDLSVLDIFGALCGGATLFPVDNHTDRIMPTAFIKRNKLTIWNSVPSVVDLMVRSRKLDTDHLGSLRLMTFCGEPLLKEHLDAIFIARPDITVYNMYGPTEATVSCTALPLTSENYLEACGSNSVALGEGIRGMRILLIGGEDNNEGEIAISGPQLARGYWQAPQLTSNAFQTIEVGNEVIPLYRTGDWGYRKHGHIFFGTRIDRQIKINGYRLELGEVDAAFRKAGAIASCTLMHESKLYTFVEGLSDMDLNKLKKNAAKLLPHYALPSAVTLIEQLPRNTNDKINSEAIKSMLTKNIKKGK